MPEQFAHLHVHTEYSMLDGAAKLDPLFAEAERLGQPAVAMTDHGNMFGAHDFYSRARKSNVKPIIGMEAYVAPASRYHKKPVFWGKARTNEDGESTETGGDVSGGGSYTHMTMWARNATGLRNLFRLSSLASFQGYYRKPRVDRELIAEHAEGIMATTGCPSGEVQTRLRLGQYREALQAASDYRDIFGEENFFLELMDHGLPIEKNVREDLLRIRSELGLTPVATNDSHYVTADQAESHGALLCVQTGKTLSDPKRFKFDSDDFYLKSAEEMREYWDKEVPGACDATLEIAERVESYEDVFAEKDRMPRVPLAPGQTEEEKLREEVEQYIPTRFPNGLTDEYRQRVEWELEVICGKGYASYFLVVGDLVRWAKSHGIRVGPGRGSATGALVSYILQIINLDPIEHSLIFERFLNPERDSPPDIDLDFDDRRRDEVMAYTRDTYGQENVAQVITFGMIKTKAALKDAARAHHGQPGFAIAEKMSKALPPPVSAKDIPLEGIVDPQHERYQEAAEIRSMIENDQEIAQIFNTARGLEGLIRNAGVHACAYILSSEPLLDVLPLWMREDGAIITGWDYPACEEIGLLKMDFLGLSTLTIIEDAIRAVQKNHGIEINLDTLGLDDPETYELLSRGDTLGVFQLDGGGMRTLLKAMSPSHFGDVSAALALYRPGPMAVNAHMAYAERSNGRATITPIHPELKDALDPILGESYHLLVYQEQVMAIAQQLAGYSLGEADLLRKAMGKKKPEVIAKESEKFLAGMKQKGFSDEAAQTLWDTILPFAGYAFNKSHTAGYAMVSYWTAYLKAHYPAEFMAAQLTANANDKDKSAVYLSECRRMNVRVLPPDVNESDVQFAAVNGNIRFGLGAVRNVGTGVARAIIDARREKGEYTSFADFLQKVPANVCQKRVVESLIKAGAFDSFGVPRQALVRVHEEAVDAVSGIKKHEAMGQFDLFGGGSSDDSAETSPLAHLTFDTQEWPRKQLLAFEREMLGLYVSAHPLDGAQGILRKHAPKPIATIKHEAPAEGEITLAGIISSVDRRVSKKTGEPWAIVTIEDLDASIEVLFFAKAYAAFGEELVTDAAVAVKGKVNWRDDIMSVFASGLTTLDISSAEYNPVDGELPFVLRADATKVDKETVAELRSALSAHRGETPVQVVIAGNRETRMELPEDYSVRISNTLLGELKGIRGVTVLDTTGVGV
ncbi:DNA polymerase III subunit alpha [Actinopolyspora mortivallis]|uniref:DNA polymerase III subunit alpha n=1 Tax=Actinopolyspora mortivallis TaxID=33906 RepID=A0A2T0GT49_ACTMO|nr:DNA polymerase III subunit alpha [Actinopolyspora mortivallis]PRW62279.1 DNA polymerase III subunit alpha [Actinopolyspora mortivallis]